MYSCSYKFINYIGKFIKPIVTDVTITPAISIPKTIRGNAFLIGTPKTKATKEPVQAPVKGNGIATKATKANSFQRLNFFKCFL